MNKARAQGIAEYGLIILFIVLVAAVALVFLGNNIGNFINSMGGGFNKCAPTGGIGKPLPSGC